MQVILIIVLSVLFPCYNGFLTSGQASSSVPLRGIDCRNPSRFRSTSFTHVCKHHELDPPQQVEAALLQRLTDHKLTAIRCERRITVIHAICAVWSHSKLIHALDVQQLEPFSSEECRIAVEKKLYTTNQNKVIPLEYNKEIQYHETITGYLQTTPNDVRCYGGSRKINGIVHSDLVSLATYTVVLREVKLEMDTRHHRLTDLDARVEIDVGCASKDACQDNNMGYVVLNKDTYCPYVLLQAGLLDIVPLTSTKGESISGILAREKKSLFRLGDIIPTPECLDFGTVHSTNHPNVFLLYPDNMEGLKEGVKKAKGTDVDLELEIASSEAYLEYRFLESVSKYLGASLQALCGLGIYNMPALLPSPLHPDRFIQISGEVLSELQCIEVTTIARIGTSPVPWCARDLLPVEYLEKQMFIQANTRMIIESVPDVHINCTVLNRPLFLSDSGEVVTADPVIKFAKIELSNNGLNLFNAYINVSTLGEDNFGKSLLYDHEVMEELNHNLHFGLTKSKVVSSLTKAYCAKGECGDYQPTDSSGFNLNHLVEHAEERLNFGQLVYDKLVAIGSFTSLFVAAYYIGVVIVWFLKKTMPCTMHPPAWLPRFRTRTNQRLPSDVQNRVELAELLTARIKRSQQRPTTPPSSFSEENVHYNNLVETNPRNLLQ